MGFISLGADGDLFFFPAGRKKEKARREECKTSSKQEGEGDQGQAPWVAAPLQLLPCVGQDPADPLEPLLVPSEHRQRSGSLLQRRDELSSQTLVPCLEQ